jgi:hypothetical protein
LIPLYAVVIIVCAEAVFIWFSVRAKPLAGMRYRWATYIAWTMILIAELFREVAFVAFRSGDLFAAMGSVGLGIGSITSCVGILSRRRYGVWHFIFVFTSLLTIRIAHKDFDWLLLGMFFPTLIYFKRRYKLLAEKKEESGWSTTA